MIKAITFFLLFTSVFTEETAKEKLEGNVKKLVAGVKKLQELKAKFVALKDADEGQREEPQGELNTMLKDLFAVDITTPHTFTFAGEPAEKSNTLFEQMKNALEYQEGDEFNKTIKTCSTKALSLALIPVVLGSILFML